MKRSRHGEGDEGEKQSLCWLCERPLGEAVELHHPVPKAKKGRRVVSVHPICHQAIHANYTNSELGRFGDDRSRLIEHPALVKFLAWVADKPADFHAPTRQKR